MTWRQRFIPSWLPFFKAASQEPAEKKISVLRSNDLSLYAPAAEGFKQFLKNQGKGAAFAEYTLPAVAAEVRPLLFHMATQTPDLILALGGSAARAARSALKWFPVVFSMVADPEREGLTCAGVSLEARPLDRIGMLRQTFPSLRRIGVISTPGRNQPAVRELKEIKRQGAAQVALMEIGSAVWLDGAVAHMARKADCLLVLCDPALYAASLMPRVIRQCSERRLPVVGLTSTHVRAGALAAVYADPEDNGRMAGEMAWRIFQGDKPKKIPVQWPRKIQMTINPAVAERLGIQINPGAASEVNRVLP